MRNNCIIGRIVPKVSNTILVNNDEAAAMSSNNKSFPLFLSIQCLGGSFFLSHRPTNAKLIELNIRGNGKLHFNWHPSPHKTNRYVLMDALLCMYLYVSKVITNTIKSFSLSRRMNGNWNSEMGRMVIARSAPLKPTKTIFYISTTDPLYPRYKFISPNWLVQTGRHPTIWQHCFRTITIVTKIVTKSIFIGLSCLMKPTSRR